MHSSLLENRDIWAYLPGEELSVLLVIPDQRGAKLKLAAFTATVRLV